MQVKVIGPVQGNDLESSVQTWLDENEEADTHGMAQSQHNGWYTVTILYTAKKKPSPYESTGRNG